MGRFDSLRRTDRSGQIDRSGAEAGFILLESLIAITLIVVIVAAVGVEYVSSLASTSRQRATQVATELAQTAIEQARALNPSDLVTGRSASSVNAEFMAGNAIPLVAPWLSSMDQTSDPNAPSGSGATASIPTAAVSQQPGATSYQVTQFLGTCQLISTGTGSNCVPQAQVPSTQAAAAVQYLRLVVTVGWTASTCISTPCIYIASTLINAAPDPTFRVNQPPPAAPLINPPGNQTNEVGDVTAVQLALQTGTGVPAFSWAVTAGSLPNGLTLDPVGGLISGTIIGPTGSQNITVQVIDGYGRTATAAFTWAVYAGPSITAPPAQQTAINTAVSLPVTTTCSNTPCTYTLNNGPSGLSINNTGVVTGSPTVAGAVTTSVTVTDASHVSQTSATFIWTVVAPLGLCNPVVSLPNGSFESPGVPAGAGRNVGNGTSGLAWATNDSNGQIELWANGGSSTSNNSGTPITAQDGSQWVEVDGAGLDTLYQNLATTPGQVLQWSIWHRARNATGNVAAQDTIQVQMGTTTNQTPQVSTSSTTPAISDGASAWVNYTGTYTVPAGQTTTRFQVAAISTSSGSASAGNFLDGVSVVGAPCLSSMPTSQTSTVNTAISPVQLTANQGSGSYAWSGGSSLPPGLSLSAAGLITGTPTTTGATPVALTLTDTTSGYKQSLSFSWNVRSAPTLTTANQVSTVGYPTSVSVSATCPNTPCSYALAGQPSGLTISQTSGTISGTPTTVGTSNPVTVTITDSYGASAASSFTWAVKAAPTITTPSSQVTDVGTSVSLPITSTCANATCTYSLTGAPAGLTISAGTGTITGTPTTPGTSSSTRVTITDNSGVSSSATFSWTVYAAPTLASPGNQATTVNTAVILRATSTCSNSPCTFTLAGAPNGLSINANTGTITGTPTATGTSSSTRITLTDNSGVTATATIVWAIYARPSVTAPSNQSTANNATVSLALASSCPNAPCAYMLTGAPAGLSVSSSGTVIGTVSNVQQALTGVTVTVTDSSGATATTAAFNWTVTTPLVGRWSFDETSGTSAADSSGAGHNATLSGGYSKTAAAAQGARAVALNGTSGTYATTSGPVLNTANSFTVSVWAKLASTSDYSTFAAQSGTNVGGFYLQYNPSTNRFRFYKLSSDSTGSSGAAQSSVAAPVIGQWYQLTGVYDATAGTISLFVNGVRQGAPVAAPGGFNATGNFTMGAGNFGGLTNWTNGAVDDVRAYSGALTDSAVAQIAQAGYWNLDEGSGTTARDSSLNGINGTLNGATSWGPGIVGPSAGQFDGNSSTITSSGPVIDTSQSFTVSAWAKATNANTAGTLVSVDGSNYSGFFLFQYGTTWALLRQTSDSNSAYTLVNSTGSITAGQWYLVTGVYDSVAQTLTLYVNGVRQGSVSYTTGWKASGSLVIGRGKYNGSALYNFNGTIDDVHAYQFAMDQAGVNALSAQTPPAPAAPTASAGSQAATVSWSAPANVAGSPVTGYVVTPYLDGVAQTPTTYSSTATTQTLTGLATGQSYTFTVAAVNANGTSNASAQSAAVQPS